MFTQYNCITNILLKVPTHEIRYSPHTLFAHFVLISATAVHLYLSRLLLVVFLNHRKKVRHARLKRVDLGPLELPSGNLALEEKINLAERSSSRLGETEVAVDDTEET